MNGKKWECLEVLSSCTSKVWWLVSCLISCRMSFYLIYFFRTWYNKWFVSSLKKKTSNNLEYRDPYGSECAIINRNMILRSKTSQLLEFLSTVCQPWINETRLLRVLQLEVLHACYDHLSLVQWSGLLIKTPAPLSPWIM